MGKQALVVPDIGDFDKVEVIEVSVKVGDTIKKDDTLITLESDKASMEYARDKRERKHLDMIIANDVSDGVFGSDNNQITLIDSKGETTLPAARKTELARDILNILISRI